jgi:probable F420-dependent oxidoreductase
MRIGAKVPNSGPLPVERGIGAMAKDLESAGFESLWVSDHVVMPSVVTSWYPFAADGKPDWPSTTPYFDAMISLTAIAAATERAVIGTAVLVLPMRHPVILAKEAASIDVLSGGRLTLGIGVGWLGDEYDALNVPFETRGSRFVEWIEILRRCWTGSPESFEGEFYSIPSGVQCMPQPAHDIPLLVGGHSKTAFSRAGSIANGWLAQQSATELDHQSLRDDIAHVRHAAESSDHDPSLVWTTLRIVDSAANLDATVRALPLLRESGVDEIIVDADWTQPTSLPDVYGVLRNAGE